MDTLSASALRRPPSGGQRTRQRAWEAEFIARIEADFSRSADTHLIHVPLSRYPSIHVYFKDESSHPTGNLKHRLARSLFLYALSNGRLREGAPVIEASSGSTAVSEAYFVCLLGLPFIAVVPAATSPEKIAAIEFHGADGQLGAVLDGAPPQAALRDASTVA